MPDGKPNIVAIWCDDIGISNLSCYSDGVMGYRTPNIDRIANEACASPIPTVSRAAPRAEPRSSAGRASPAPGAVFMPELIRWPGKIKAGSTSNDIIQHHDWLPTLLAAAGDPDVSANLKTGYQVADVEYEVHIDGFNLMPYLMGEVEHSPRRGFFYFNDDAQLVGMRFAAAPTGELQRRSGRRETARVPGQGLRSSRHLTATIIQEGDCACLNPSRTSW